ncbi:hypothetical protein GCL60_14825 [Silvanigrella paludirubra]|uniref:Uncharacterized protein n=1 Tax=Silvanigrella paludirubra TaxID=2499159 RepID=A0A6N6VS17_9BACT|nr:hypothetical protein [Silvanigrella paludirubra]KAB8037100.1 hypothetical protein GCL60_14825 [Silvanigrella paludirubra]
MQNFSDLKKIKRLFSGSAEINFNHLISRRIIIIGHGREIDKNVTVNKNWAIGFFGEPHKILELNNKYSALPACMFSAVFGVDWYANKSCYTNEKYSEVIKHIGAEPNEVKNSFTDVTLSGDYSHPQWQWNIPSFFKDPKKNLNIFWSNPKKYIESLLYLPKSGSWIKQSTEGALYKQIDQITGSYDDHRSTSISSAQKGYWLWQYNEPNRIIAGSSSDSDETSEQEFNQIHESYFDSVQEIFKKYFDYAAANFSYKNPGKSRIQNFLRFTKSDILLVQGKSEITSSNILEFLKKQKINYEEILFLCCRGNQNNQDKTEVTSLNVFETRLNRNHFSNISQKNKQTVKNDIENIYEWWKNISSYLPQIPGQTFNGFQKINDFFNTKYNDNIPQEILMEVFHFLMLNFIKSMNHFYGEYYKNSRLL